MADPCLFSTSTLTFLCITHSCNQLFHQIYNLLEQIVKIILCRCERTYRSDIDDAWPFEQWERCRGEIGDRADEAEREEKLADE